MEFNEKKHIYELNKVQNHHAHLTKVKNDFVSFLLKEIKTHVINIEETGNELSKSALTVAQINSLDQIKTESEHAFILIEEIFSFLDIDTLKYGLHELQFDFKDYFEKRKNNNFMKDFALQRPLNILLLEEDLFNKKYARIVFESLGYSPDFSISLADRGLKEYDVVFVDLTKGKNILQEQSDTIFAYFSDKKRTQVVAISHEDISPESKKYFQHVIDWNLIFPVKMRDLTDLLENVWKKAKADTTKPAQKFIPDSITGRLIEEDNISFIQEIQSEEDIVFFIELIDIFIVETPKIFKVIRTAISKLDYDKIHFGGHKLRGSSLTMGIELFINIGLQLEQCAREKNLANAEELVNELEHNFVQVVEELEEIKEKYRIKYLGDI